MITKPSFQEIKTDFFTFFKGLSEDELTQLAEERPVFNPDGHPLTPKNISFLQFQNTQNITFTVVAGYKQWKKYGRQVMKGQRGYWIFIPAMSKSIVNGQAVEELERFLMAKVFDVTQTCEAGKEEEWNEVNEQREDYDCEDCDEDCEFYEECEFWKENILGPTGHGDICWSDADPGL